MSPNRIYGAKGLVVLIACCSMLSGCAWYEGIGTTYDERGKNIGNYDISEQDEYLRKFYELQRRIDELEGKVERKTAAPKSSFYKINKRAESAIAYLKEKTRNAIKVIDDLIAQVDGKSNLPTERVVDKADSPMPSLTVKKGDISGVLERSDSGEVVKSTTSGNRYNYSVVYVYPEIQPWFDMWDILNNAGITDKWRGKNDAKQTYFIYVGAYYTSTPAKKRQDSLLAITGEKPEVRVRNGYESIAMK